MPELDTCVPSKRLRELIILVVGNEAKKNSVRVEYVERAISACTKMAHIVRQHPDSATHVGKTCLAMKRSNKVCIANMDNELFPG